MCGKVTNLNLLNSGYTCTGVAGQFITPGKIQYILTCKYFDIKHQFCGDECILFRLRFHFSVSVFVLNGSRSRLFLNPAGHLKFFRLLLLNRKIKMAAWFEAMWVFSDCSVAEPKPINFSGAGAG